MNAQELVQQIRDHYVDLYRRAVGRWTEKYPDAEVEAFVEGKPSVFARGRWRADLLADEDGAPKIIEVNPEEFVSDKRTTIVWNGLTLEMSPMHWNSVELLVDGPTPNDSHPLYDWVDQWLDAQERRIAASPKLGSVIHSVLSPKSAESRWSTAVDFGSAEPEAFWSLLSLLRESEAPRVCVGSLSTIRPDPG